LSLSACSSGRHRRLICGLWRGIFNNGNRLVRPLLRVLVGVDVRRRAKQQSDIFNNNKKNTKIRKLNTYRSDRRWVAVNLLLALPVGACAPASATRGAVGSLATRSVVAGALSGRLRGLRTSDGAASSSSSSSSVIRTSRRRFGAWLSLLAASAQVKVLLPMASSQSPCPRWLGWDGLAPPHCWCTEHTEQRPPPTDPPLRDSPS